MPLTPFCSSNRPQGMLRQGCLASACSYDWKALEGLPGILKETNPNIKLGLIYNKKSPVYGVRLSGWGDYTHAMDKRAWYQKSLDVVSSTAIRGWGDTLPSGSAQASKGLWGWQKAHADVLRNSGCIKWACKRIHSGS